MLGFAQHDVTTLSEMFPKYQPYILPGQKLMIIVHIHTVSKFYTSRSKLHVQKVELQMQYYQPTL